MSPAFRLISAGLPGLGLDDLGAAHLTTLKRNTGIMAHILGLEGRYAVTLAGQYPAKCGCQQTFSSSGWSGGEFALEGPGA